MWSFLSTGSIRFVNNIFINTLSSPTGMLQGIAPQAVDALGSNTFVAMRSPHPVNIGNAWFCAGPQIKDGAWWNPDNNWFQMDAAVIKTVTDARLKPNTAIVLAPTNTSATLLPLYISAQSSGSFMVHTGSGNAAAGTEIYNYFIMPAVRNF